MSFQNDGAPESAIPLLGSLPQPYRSLITSKIVARESRAHKHRRPAQQQCVRPTIARGTIVVIPNGSSPRPRPGETALPRVGRTLRPPRPGIYPRAGRGWQRRRGSLRSFPGRWSGDDPVIDAPRPSPGRRSGRDTIRVHPLRSPGDGRVKMPFSITTVVRRTDAECRHRSGSPVSFAAHRARTRDAAPDSENPRPGIPYK